jgi:thiol:disulfide interchange protein
MNLKLKILNLKLWLPLAFLLCPHFVTAKTPWKTQASLVSEHKIITPGQTFTVALKFEIAEHWHTYWRNPGDAGIATKIIWDLPAGFTAGEIQWPTPQRLAVGNDIVNFGYEGEVWHLVAITAAPEIKPGSQIVLKARVDWLECEEICVPGRADLQMTLMVGSGAAVSESLVADFSKARLQIPAPDKTGSVQVERHGDFLHIILNKSNSEPERFFFPYAEGLILNSGEQKYITAPGKQSWVVPLQKDLAPFSHIAGVLTGGRENREGALAFEAKVTPVKEVSTSTQIKNDALFSSLFLGFLGGLILNLMPCVFPVLGLKIMSFARQAGQERKQVARHGWAFSGGVLLSFWLLAGVLLALRAGGQELGWGFQLQSAPFVYALLVILLVFGLNMSGVFEVGASWVGAGANLSSGSSLGGSFFSGVLATVVATPCAAPFLAPALGAALALPTLPSIALFTAIGAGLAAPYLVLSLKPEWVRSLPKPGAWMETLRQGLAFFLYGTAVYLLWVLEGQVGEYSLLNILFSLILISLACWVYGRFTGLDRTEFRRRTGWIAAGLIVLLGLWLGYPSDSKTDTDTIQWEAWSPELVEKYQSEGRIIYVDFTARWCATCQTNKKAVFSSKEILKEFRRRKVATLKADWTRQDPRITKTLSAYGRSAVPFNLLYAPGRKDPVILPELLTSGTVLEQLQILPE